MSDSTEAATGFEMYGWEFRRRMSGSCPWRYRRVGACDHDWELLKFDHPLASFLRFMAPAEADQ